MKFLKKTDTLKIDDCVGTWGRDEVLKTGESEMNENGECVSECVCVCVNMSPVHTWDRHLHPQKGGKNKSVQRRYQKKGLRRTNPTAVCVVACSCYIVRTDNCNSLAK